MKRTPTVHLWLIPVVGVALISGFGLAGNTSGARSIDPIIEASVCVASTESLISVDGGPVQNYQFEVNIQLDPFYAVTPDVCTATVILEIQQSTLLNMSLTTQGAPAPSKFTLTSLSPNGDFFPADAFGEAWFVLTHDLATDTLYQDPTTPFQIESTAPLDTFPQLMTTYSLVSPVVFGNDYGDTVVIESGTVTIIDSLAIPTLTEWGMIIFSVLLFAFMAWILVNSKKRTALRI